MPSQTWNIEKVAQPVYVEYSARDSIDYQVAIPAGSTTKVAPLTADTEEKIPTYYGNTILVAWETTIVAGNIIIRKYHNAGQSFIDEVFAIAAATKGIARSVTPLECCEVYVQNNDIAAKTAKVTVMCRA